MARPDMTAAADGATPAVHVVGAGVAGMAAALALARRGGGRAAAVTLHEAAPGAGGRCRALPDGTDNGTHALLGANRAALRFLDAIGARAGWVEPEPAGLPVLDLATGAARRVALSPVAWVADASLRPPGLSARALFDLARLALPFGDRPVADAFARYPVLHRTLVEPLVVAALNTPSAEASSRRLGAVLRRIAVGGPGAARLLVAREGLGPDLVAPALAALRAAGVTIRIGARLRAVRREGGRATALDFGEDGGGITPLGAADAVVLALPPWEAARLLPGLPAVPTRFAPILNLHYAHPTAPPGGPVRFLGLLGGLAHWVLVRPTAGVAVTVSAADAAMAEDAAALSTRAWVEIRAAARAFALPGDWPAEAPPCRVVRERRATPRHGAGAAPAAPPRRPLANLALAGDWTLPALPATIEAAVISGERAAAAILAARPFAAWRGALRPRPAASAGAA